MRFAEVRAGLHGRADETARLDALLAAVRAGESRALVLRGPAGIGKSTLLEYTAEHASGFRVERAVGIESELELAFAGLHQLCLPLLDHLDQLPEPQHAALSTAFGISTGNPPDRFLVGLAVLNLLSVVAEDQPLLALVDDAQWLDEVSLQVLAFVGRRLRGESVALVFAVRPDQQHQALVGLTQIQVSSLQDQDAHALLDSVLNGPLDDAVRDRIVADSRGCPLALIELPSGLTPSQLAGGFGIPGTLPIRSSLEEAYSARLAPLPAGTRTLLLAAALEPTGDIATLWRAAEELDVGAEAAGAAEASGLVELRSRVRFKHPLVRSAVHRAADPGEIRRVHQALASVTDPDRDPDRRAWHRSLAAEGPDESVAGDLERSAGRAQERGGLAAAAAFLAAAVGLTLRPERRGARALAAAQAKFQAGASDEALTLLALAQKEPLDERNAAQAMLLDGQIAYFASHSRAAAPLLMSAAGRWRRLDPAVARDVYLDAIAVGLVVGRFAGEVGLVEVARAAHELPTSTERAGDVLLNGFATVLTQGYAAGAHLLKQALTRLRDDVLPNQDIRLLWLGTHAARDLWDDETWDLLSARHIRTARAAGALAALPSALSAQIGLHLAAGEITAARLLVEETAEVAAAAGTSIPPYGAIALAAWQGDEATFSKLTSATQAATSARGDGLGMAIVQYAGAVLHNSRGDYGRALAEAEAGAAHPNDLCYATWSLVELIEAASRSGETARAASAVERLAESTQASGTDWALGIEARSRALVSDGDTADALYREAIGRLAATRVRMELARAHLLHGEWQRRAGRRLDARDNLRTAHELFIGFGSDALAERARRELVATGETVRARSVATEHELTAQESQIALLAAQGRTNPEIGAELFLSARTVEWHLGKVYPKLGIGSRRALRRALAEIG
ncbi:ATP-binding protein [Occultella gossypii]|uniref:AAA family ATPase n=1 Tax=Occultella gossypii TaxID=2800820 RepID=A0ABS7SF77_9MICO|nr:helix-turn-helix transcriptional regulator [Occultella gossypii]MBZ2199006.1 AAA family ATPase [Occultella gossypii]